MFTGSTPFCARYASSASSSRGRIENAAGSSDYCGRLHGGDGLTAIDNNRSLSLAGDCTGVTPPCANFTAAFIDYDLHILALARAEGDINLVDSIGQQPG